MTQPKQKHKSRPTTQLKEDLFCYYLITGLSVADAYAEVGFSPDGGNAYKFYLKRTVQARLSALRGEIEKRILAADSALWGDDDLRKFLQVNAVEARSQGDYAPSNRAVELLGRDRGMFGAQGQIGAGGLVEGDPREEAERVAAWLEEMRDRHEVQTIDDLASLLRGDTTDNGHYRWYATEGQVEGQDTTASDHKMLGSGEAEDGENAGLDQGAPQHAVVEADAAGQPGAEGDALEGDAAGQQAGEGDDALEGGRGGPPGGEGGGIPPDADRESSEGPQSIGPREKKFPIETGSEAGSETGLDSDTHTPGS